MMVFDLTGGVVWDGCHFETLLDMGSDIGCAAFCDKGYASEAIREVVRARGVARVMPHKVNV